MSVRNSILVLGATILLQACASIQNPEGGPKDMENPKLLVSFPQDKATNVTSQTIRLTFDEEVQAPNLTKQLLISPNTDPKYSVKTSRNTVELQFDKPFEPNTTYQLNFREGIVDITEGNKVQNLVITFSTGPALDSAQLNGSVKTLFTNTPEANMVVALYPESDTANIRANKPYYFTHTDASGSFQFTNIKTGNYWIFAHHDKNNNQIYDSEAEAIGYKAKPVSANPADTTKKEPLVLLTGKADTRKPFVLKKEPFTDNYALTFNEGIETFAVSGSNAPKLATNTSPDGKLVRIFPTPAYTGGRLILASTDSAGNKGIDTVNVTFSGNRHFRAPGSYKLVNTTGSIASDQSVIIQFEVPIARIEPDAFTLVEDTLKSRKLTTAEVNLSPDQTTLTFKPKLTARQTITIQTDSNKVISVSGQPMTVAPLKLSITDQLSTGALSGKVITKYQNYQVELINSSGTVVKQLSNIKSFSFPDLLPGTYSFRVKIDQNNNKRWEGIQRNLKVEPELIYFHPEPIEVRANWEIEDLKLEF